MNFNLKISITLIISWLFSPDMIFSDLTGKHSSNLYRSIENSNRKEIIYNLAYEEAIVAIKEHEGFNGGKIYTDIAGIRTVGYGHVILPTDTFTVSVSEHLADKILRQDFDKSIRFAKSATNLSGHKLIAVAHFIFGNGAGRFDKSILKKKILKNEPVDDEFKKWSYYRNTNNEVLQHDNLSKMREWEVYMYNK